MMKYIFLALLILANLSLKGWGEVVNLVPTVISVDRKMDNAMPIGLIVHIKLDSNTPGVTYGFDIEPAELPYQEDESGAVTQYCLQMKYRYEGEVALIEPHVVTIEIVPLDTLTLGPNIKKG